MQVQPARQRSSGLRAGTVAELRPGRATANVEANSYLRRLVARDGRRAGLEKLLNKATAVEAQKVSFETKRKGSNYDPGDR